MNPVCEQCQGACCESFVVALPQDPAPDFVRWLSLRGTVTSGALRLEVPCRELADGRCGIWDTRPQPCRDYQVGSPACRQAIKARRSDRADVLLDTLEEWKRSSSPPGGSSSPPAFSGPVS